MQMSDSEKSYYLLYPLMPLAVLSKQLLLSKQLSDVETSSNFNSGNAHLQKMHNLKHLPAL